MTYLSPPLSLCKLEWLTYHAFFQSLNLVCHTLHLAYGMVWLCVCEQRVKNQSKTSEFWLKSTVSVYKACHKESKILEPEHWSSGHHFLLLFDHSYKFLHIFLRVDFKSSCSAYPPTYYLGVIKSNKPPTLLRIQLFIVKEHSYMVWMKIYRFSGAWK